MNKIPEGDIFVVYPSGRVIVSDDIDDGDRMCDKYSARSMLYEMIYSFPRRWHPDRMYEYADALSHIRSPRITTVEEEIMGVSMRYPEVPIFVSSNQWFRGEIREIDLASERMFRRVR